MNKKMTTLLTDLNSVQNIKSNPHYYENVSVNFDALENAYRTVNPRDTFYQVGFGMTYAMKKSLESQELEININKEEQ